MSLRFVRQPATVIPPATTPFKKDKDNPERGSLPRRTGHGARRSPHALSVGRGGPAATRKTTTKTEWLKDRGHFQEGQLPNGMRVRICPTKAAGPKVRVQNVYNFGSNAEVSDAERGLAHVIEHMIFKGTTADALVPPSAVLPQYQTNDWQQGVPQATLEARVRAQTPDALAAMTQLAEMGALHLSETDIDTIGRYYGASMNAFTSQDKTSYYFEMGKHAFAPFLNIFAASMKSSRLDEQHLRSEILAVLNEMAIGNDNYPREAIGVLRERIYAAHEAGHYDTIGSEKDLLNLDAQVLRTFYDKHYQPWNATLYVVGDVDPVRVGERVRRVFGKFKTAAYHDFQHTKKKQGASTSSGTPRPTLVPKPLSPPPSTSRTLLYHDVHQPTLLYSFRLGGSETPSKYWTTAALSMGLSQTSESRLQRNLVHTEPSPLAHAVETFAEQYQNDGEFYVLVEPALDPAATQALAAMEARPSEATRGAFTRAFRRTLDKVEEALSATLAEPWGKAETEAINTRLADEAEERTRSLDAFTNQWVDMVGCGVSATAAFTPPVVSQKAMDGLCSERLQLQYTHLAIITPKAGAPGYEKTRQERAAQRLVMTDVIHKTKARDLGAHPLEAQSFAVPQKLPALAAFEPGEFVVPGLVTQRNTDVPVALTAPTYPRTHCSTWLRDGEALALTQKELQLSLAVETALKQPAVRAAVKELEDRGDSVVVGALGAGYKTTHGDVAPYRAVLAAVAACRFLDTNQGFRAAKAAAVQGLKALSKSSTACALHAVQQHVYGFSKKTKSRNPKWTFADAAATLSDTTASECVELLHTWWTPEQQLHVTLNDGTNKKTTTPASAPAPARPPPLRKGVQRCPEAAPLDLSLDFGSAQTTLVFARRGSGRADLESEARRRLLEVVAFHSLGSRLYKIRERTGLFYAAGGSLGLGAGTDHGGVDQITLRCKPDKVEEASAAIDAFLASFRDGACPITALELTSAKAVLKNRVMDQTLPQHLVGTMQRWLCTQGKPDAQALERFVETIDKVDTRILNAVARQTFAAPFDIRVRAGQSKP